MIFLAMIIALSLQQVLQPGNWLQRDHWLFRWDSRVGDTVSSETLRAVITLGVLILGIFVGLSWLDGELFGLLELLVTTGLFVWSLGREDFHTALERYEARIKDNPQDAHDALEGLWVPAGSAEPVSEQAADMERLMYSGYARWFAPLLYFALAGPAAAVLYRAVSALAHGESGAVYESMLRWLDWIPVRLLGITFALSGDFVAVSQRLSLARFFAFNPAPAFLRELATDACNAASGARPLGDILYRSAGLWLLVLSLMMILA